MANIITTNSKHRTLLGLLDSFLFLTITLLVSNVFYFKTKVLEGKKQKQKTPTPPLSKLDKMQFACTI